MNNYGGFQQQFGGPGFQQQGVGYAAQRRTPNFTQPLDPETIRKMRGGNNKRFTTKITKEEQNRAICTHKDPDRNNEFSFIDENDGSVTCYICGANFMLEDYTREQVSIAVDNVLDIIQNIKTVYVDIPMNVATEYMTMMVFLEKLPELYEIAYNNFDSYDRSSHFNQNTNAFGVFNSIMSPGYGGYMQQQPGINTGYNQGYQQQNQMGGNPFGQNQGYNQGYQQQSPQNQQQAGSNTGGNQQQGTPPNGTNMPGYNQNVNIDSGVFNV